MLDSLFALWPLWSTALLCWLLVKAANIYIRCRKRMKRI